MDEIELEGRHAALLEALSVFDKASENDSPRPLDERELEASHYRFQAAILPAPLRRSRLSGVRVEHRGRLEGWGLADDLIVHCSRRDAWNSTCVIDVDAGLLPLWRGCAALADTCTRV